MNYELKQLAMNARRSPNKGTAMEQDLAAYDKLIREPWLAEMIDQIRGGNEELKKELPFRAAHYSRFQNNHRTQKDADPDSFLFQTTVDVDKKELVEPCIRRAMELNTTEGSMWKGMLLHADYSARGKVHFDIRMPKGMTIAETQRAYCQALGIPDEYDESCTTPERIIFITDIRQEIYRSDEWYAQLSEEELAERRQAFEDRGLTKDGVAPSNSPKGGVNESEKGEVAATSQDITPAAEGASLSLGEGRGEVDYARVIPAFFQLENSSYPNIMEGVRNDTLFNVCAKYLRYCCDHNAAKMKELLYPDYSFGLPEKEVDSIIRSALARERGLTPNIVKKILGMGKKTVASDQTYANGVKAIDEMYGMGSDEEDSPEGWNVLSQMYPSVAECIATDLMLPRLPKFLEILLKVCPPGHKFVTLGCLIPALMTLLTWVNCKFGSKSVSRLNGWSHLDGPTGSGKKTIVEPIELLLTPIKEQDDRNRAAINQAIGNRDVNQNKETLEPIPELALRLLPPNTTRNGHIGMMANAKGAHTYTLATELSSLNINASGYYNRADFARLLFENGEVGTVTKMDTQKKLVTQCNWNVTTSSTRDQTVSHWRNVTDGSVGRAMFLLMPDTTFSETPDYVQYTEADRAYVIRAARIMTELKGLVETPKLSRTLYQWLHDVLVQTRQEKNPIKAILRKRSADISFYFGTVIHLCFIVQQIMDEEDELAARSEALKKEQTEAVNDPEHLQDVENRMIAFQQERSVWQANRLDLSRFREKKACSDIAEYVAQYTMDTQYALFGKKMLQQMKCSYDGVIAIKKSDDKLNQVPERFTISDLCQQFTEMKRDGVRKMVNRWEQAYLIKRVALENHQAIYCKV